MSDWREFAGPNAGYVLELYDRYRQNPDSVDAATRDFFAHWTPPVDGAGPMPAPAAAPAAGVPTAEAVDKIAAAVNLAQAIRSYGHLDAQLDPLGSPPRGDPSLELATYGLTEDDLCALPASLVEDPALDRAGNAFDAIQHLRAVYASTTGYGFGHIHVPEERDWLRQAVESRRFYPAPDSIDARGLLERLTQVEVFEQFLHRAFPGKTRFSLEGLDILVPILDEVLCEAAGACTHNILIGMAHRGRLNVLAHILNKPYSQILAEFKDPARAPNLSLRENLGWTGDVRYHAGGMRALPEGDQGECEQTEMFISMPPNPSHLEAINPVVEGMARAAGTSVDEPGPPRFDPAVSLPILIHGDAAFPGEGVVSETLNMSRLPGYDTGGTLHIITNNQLGYTTEPAAGRSTLFASDLARGFEIPIVHINADAPEACIEAARLAAAYRDHFHKDFLIDLIGYRRFGHNEGDEPSFTQPLMYEKIGRQPTVRKLWADTLVERGVIAPDEPQKLIDRFTNELQAALDSLNPERDLVEPLPANPPPGAARHVKTAVPATRLKQLNDALLTVPDGFTLNPKLDRPMRRRRTALDNPDEPAIDWGMAEQLALASILEDGIAIRLTGEDVERGTFGQRHAVWHDVKTGRTYTPLETLPQARAAFEVQDSPLSETAALGFEYGYNVQEPGRLVLWEAQYGDFINVAQVIVDEFITSARAKWGQTPSLVMLLPHAWEGQGPDHSSARLERFLQLAAETNIRVANCTTAGQYFHLLRRQALLLETDPLPLVVMTPKSLLRHPQAASSLHDLSKGRWQPVIDDDQARTHAKQVRRLILCSGKVYVDLVGAPERAQSDGVAIVRVEQLYPFPADDLGSVLESYPKLSEVVWLQEEPENMGAWASVRPCLTELIAGRWPLCYFGRPSNASPAEGSTARHTANQQIIVERAFQLDKKIC